MEIQPIKLENGWILETGNDCLELVSPVKKNGKHDHFLFLQITEISHSRVIGYDDGNEPKKVYLGCEHAEIVRKHNGMYCSNCNLDFGWWCPNSPDHLCDYEQENGIDNPDDCIHCHQPLERK